MKIDALAVFYKDDMAGRDEIRFAYNLAQLLEPMGVDVFLSTDPSVTQLAEATLGSDVVTIEYDRLKKHLIRLVGNSRVDFRIKPTTSNRLPEGTLLVTSGSSSISNKESRIFTAGESSLVERGGGEICIPIGNGSAGIHAAELALPLIKKLGAAVLFYHTTWINPGITSKNPADHLSNKAERVLRSAERLANTFGVASRAVIETANGVTEGLVRCAMREHCLLIVMAHSPKVRKGSYVTQTAERSPIPMLIFGSEVR